MDKSGGGLMAQYKKPKVTKKKGAVKLFNVQVAWHCNPDAVIAAMKPKVDGLVVHWGHGAKEGKLGLSQPAAKKKTKKAK